MSSENGNFADLVTNFGNASFELLEIGQFVELARSMGFDLGQNPTETLACWANDGLIPTPVKFARSVLQEPTEHYPRIVLTLIYLIQHQPRDSDAQVVRDQFLSELLECMINRPTQERETVREFIRDYGTKYGFYKNPMRVVNALFELISLRQKLRAEIDELKTLQRKKKAEEVSRVSTYYRDRCLLCGRSLIGRGTKDRYSIDDIMKVVPTLQKEYSERYPFGVYVCRSVHKCGAPSLLHTLKVRTGRYLYGVKSVADKQDVGFYSF